MAEGTGVYSLTMYSTAVKSFREPVCTYGTLQYTVTFNFILCDTNNEEVFADTGVYSLTMYSTIVKSFKIQVCTVSCSTQ